MQLLGQIWTQSNMVFPLSILGSLLGIFLTFILALNRYEPLIDIFALSEPFIMGWTGGYISYYVI